MSLVSLGIAGVVSRLSLKCLHGISTCQAVSCLYIEYVFVQNGLPHYVYGCQNLKG